MSAPLGWDTGHVLGAGVGLNRESPGVDRQGFGNGAEARIDGATATVAATEEATPTLKSAPALVGRPESKPVAGRRAGNRREA